MLSAPGGASDVSGFLAKYDTLGNLAFATAIHGSTLGDEVTSIILDASDNVYMAGFTQSTSLAFQSAGGGSTTVTAPPGSAGYNFFIAKYNSIGAYQWGHVFGGTGDDFTRTGIDLAGGYIYLSGYFSNTVDFDPSASAANLISAGGTDIFVAKYDLNGDYVCAFRVGSGAVNDRGFGMSHDGAGYIYCTGSFGGTATDFDPTAATYTVTSTGGTDAYIARYKYVGPDTYTGVLTGDTICSGSTAYLTITMTTGPAGPYTIVYTDGVTTYTVTGVMSGVPFAIVPSPTSSTSYTVVSASYTGATSCNPPTIIITGTGSVLVTPGAGPITGNVPFCVGSTITLSNSYPGGTWSCAPSSIATIASTGVVTGVAAGTATVSYVTDCGTVTAIVTVTPTPGPIMGNTPVCVGSTIALSNSVPGGTWSSTPTSIATISSTGVVTGVAAGTATVSYVTTCGTVSAIVTVTPSPGAITGSIPFCVGSTITLSNSLAGGTWSSTPTSIATISSTGIVTGVAAGTATVSYVTTCGTVATIVTVIATPGPIMGNTPLCIGSTIALSNSVPGGTWSSAPISIATISSTGVLTGVAAGTATISYVTTCGTVSAIVTVTPSPGAITGSVPFCVGSTITLSNSLAGGTWSSVPISIATISSTGVVTGVAAGTATVSYVTPCGTVTTVVTVIPTPGPIMGNTPFCMGSTIALSNSVPGGTWSSAPTSIATIGSTGVVTGVAAGTATVSYVTTCGTVSIIVTVTPLPGAITGSVPFCEGATITLSNSLPGGTWSSVPTSIATISSTGVVTGVAAGTATVSYVTTCGTVSTIVTVIPLPGPILGNAAVCPGTTLALSNIAPGGTWSIAPITVATISPTGVVSTIITGTATVTYVTACGTVTATVTVNPGPGPITGNTPVCVGNTMTLSNVMGGGTWSSVPTSVATISSSGVVTGVAVGTATISYVTFCGTVTTIVTVTPAPGPITGNAPVCPGSTITLSNSLGGGTWSIAPSSVATIASSGVVTGVGAGTATVSYTTTCGTLTVIVTVIPLPGAITGNTPICPGGSITLSNSLAGGVWSCTPGSVATISSSGVVTAVAAGTATVSYVTTCGAATVVVTVNPIPGPITGNMPICAGSSITLSNSLAGGAWSSSSTSIATVSGGGLVTGITVGTAIISYVTSCGTATVIVTINPVPGAIMGNTPVCAGATIALSNSLAGGTWSSAPTSIATISSTGVVTGVAAGTATVSYVTNCGIVTTIVTVTPLPGVIMGNIPVCEGSTFTLSNSLAGGTWSCTPASIATISSGGVVSGWMAGTATVSYVTTCGTVTTVVTINPSPGAIGGNAPICVGGTIMLSNPVTGGVWNCTPVFVATINSVGMVTGISSGTATVIYAIGACIATSVVTVNPVPNIATLSFTNPVCGGAAGSITLYGLSAGAVYSVQYTSTSPATTTMTANGSGNIVITGLSAGTYTTIRVTNIFGCVSNVVGPVTLIEEGLPVFPTATATSPCQGDTLKLSANSVTPGVTYHWTGPTGFTSTSTDPYIYPALVSNSGTYTVTAILGLCTSAVTTVSATVHPLPVVANIALAGPGSCYGTDGWISLSGLVPGEVYSITYLFDGVPVTVSITANTTGVVRIPGLAAGTYSGFVLTSSYGCIGKTAGPVTLFFAGKPPKPVIDHNNPCIGQTLMLSATNSMPGGTYTWAYPDGGSSTLQNPIRYAVPITAAGVYTVTYSVAGCPTSDTSTVYLYPVVVLTGITHDQTIAFGTSVQLNVQGALFYRWVPNDGSLNNPNINNPIATPTDSTTYTVYGSNVGGCIDSAKVTIKIDDDIDEYIPSAFTPNGDGLNDIFRIRNMGTQRLVEFSIYNRFGERVYFNSYSKDAGWDGVYKGVPSDMGVYFYYIIVGKRDGTNRIHKGDVTLIR